MEIPSALSTLLDRFRRHVSHELVSNERLAMLLGASGTIVLVSVIFGFWNLTANMSAQLMASKAGLARLQAEVTGDAWPKRVETTQTLKSQLSVRLWDAPTPGLAEAGFETWLRNRFSRYGGTPQQIQITRSPALGRDGQPTPALAELQRMTAKVIGPFDQSVIVPFLADAAEYDKIVVVDRVIVRAGPNSRIEMDVSTFIRAGESAVGAKAKP